MTRAALVQIAVGVVFILGSSSADGFGAGMVWAGIGLLASALWSKREMLP